jgi:hypothetical protein
MCQEISALKSPAAADEGITLPYRTSLAPLRFEVHLNDLTRFCALVDFIFKEGSQKTVFADFEFDQIDPEATDSVSILQNEKS